MFRTFHTEHFGQIEVAPESIVEFPAGLPGFEELRRFTQWEHPDQPALIFLQSLERCGLCFLAVRVETLRPDYRVSIAGEDLELLGIAAGTPVRALAVISLVEGAEPTANLLSPIVIHTPTRRAVQAIRPDNLYSCREALVCS
jgi:flagellar assembly factor FliW